LDKLLADLISNNTKPPTLTGKLVKKIDSKWKKLDDKLKK